MPLPWKAGKMGILRQGEAGNRAKLATVNEKARENPRFSGLAACDGYGQGTYGLGAPAGAGTGGNIARMVLGSTEKVLVLIFSFHST